MNEQVIKLLSERLAQGLPPRTVASRFSPCPRIGSHNEPAAAEARAAAVLVLLYPRRDRWYLPLTLRSSHLTDHAGQISLPGGAVEPGESSREAALREFHEELGAEDYKIEMLGQLSPRYVARSNFLITPWVGVSRRRPHMRPSPAEVAELIEIPLAYLLDPAHLAGHRREHQGRSYIAPHFEWRSHRIWGATCTILGELVALLSEQTDI